MTTAKRADFKWPPKSKVVDWGEQKSVLLALHYYVEGRLKELRAEIQAEAEKESAEAVRYLERPGAGSVWKGGAMSSPEELAAAARRETADKWPPASKPANWGHMKNLTDAVAIHVEKRLKELRAEIQAEVVEQVAKELERSSVIRYKGTWSGPAATYRKGDAVTRDGALWVAVAEETNQRPGTGSDWQMATKSR